MKDKIIGFFQDVAKEMKKVTWPKREELRDSTIVVITVSALIMTFVFIADFLIGQVMDRILG